MFQKKHGGGPHPDPQGQSRQKVMEARIYPPTDTNIMMDTTFPEHCSYWSGWGHQFPLPHLALTKYEYKPTYTQKLTLPEHFDPEDGDSTYLWNISNPAYIDTM
jgi:hypothetical protein